MQAKAGRILRSPIAWQGKYLRAELVTYRNKIGNIATYEVIRRNTFGSIVAVMAITKNKEVVLIKSYRVPHDSYVIELPAGLADRSKEPPEVLAQRELLEETGYQPGTPLRHILSGPFDPGLHDNILTYYFTRDAEKISEPALEPAEEIEVMLVPLKDLVKFVLNPPHGCVADVKILNLLPILEYQGLLPR